MPYTMQWGSTRPGLIIILLDQSGSFSEPANASLLVFGKTKAEAASIFVNSLLHEFCKTNTVGTEIKPRAEIAVLGYGSRGVQSLLSDALHGKMIANLPELMANPLRIASRTRKEMDDTGSIIEVPSYYPVWIEPFAEGSSNPSCAALTRASELAELWIDSHPDNYPPVVINITDGLPTDGEITEAASTLVSGKTSDGNILLFNCLVTNQVNFSIEFPSIQTDLPGDKAVPVLFSVSSLIPDDARTAYSNATGEFISPNAKGFFVNHDINSIRRFFYFATVGAQPPASDRDEIVPRIKSDARPLMPIRSRRFRTSDASPAAIPFPGRVEFDEAMSIHRLLVNDSNIREGKVEKYTYMTSLGEIQVPWGLQGGFAIVYKFRAKNGELKALRVPTRPTGADMTLRYAQMTLYFELNASDITVKFKYHSSGIRVGTSIGGWQVFPLLEMDWVEGVTLIDWVDRLCQKQDINGLSDLVDRWVLLVRRMWESKIGHSDLSGANVMVRSTGELVLVDYDGIFIPEFLGQNPISIGDPDYQHPEIDRPFNERVSDFSALLLYTVLLALRENPELWNEHAVRTKDGKLINEYMLFKIEDFRHPDKSSLFQRLRTFKRPEVRLASSILEMACYESIVNFRFPMALLELHMGGDVDAFKERVMRRTRPTQITYHIPKFVRPLRVFLCHSSGDKSSVREIYEKLRADGFDPWLDEEKLLPGQSWKLEIQKAVRDSDAVIVTLSESSINRSGFLQKEIVYALDAAQEKAEGQIFLIPARLERCEVPERLRDWHWVDLFDEKGYSRMYLALQQRASELGLILR